jgi:type IV pilus assembly protein PilW
MALTLAITQMMVRHEQGRRTLTAVNDSSVGAAYLSFLLDRNVRSAGSGYGQSWRQALGCALRVARNGTTLLPRPTAFPAPFASLPQALRLAPVTVFAGAGSGGSDVLSLSTGASGLGESPLRMLPNSATSTSVRVPATVGLRAKDLVLLLQDGTPCMLQQLADGFAGGADQLLSLGGTYAAPEISSTRVDAMATTAMAWAAPLGNLAGNQPVFQFIGVGSNDTLQTYDVLRLDGSDAPVPIADGVADLRVLYGVDSDGDGKIDVWRDPAVAPYDAATLQGSTAAAQANLRSILALRIGLVLHNAVPERAAVSPTTLTLFSDLGSALQRTRTLSDSDRLLHWQTLEFTVPLRNVMLMQ